MFLVFPLLLVSKMLLMASSIHNVADRESFASDARQVTVAIEADTLPSRFYHVFAEGELAELVQSVDGLKLESVELEQGNYVAVFERIR